MVNTNAGAQEFLLNDEAVYMCAHVFVVRFLHGTLDLMVLSNIIMLHVMYYVYNVRHSV